MSSRVLAFGEKINVPIEYKQSTDIIIKDQEQIQSYLNNPAELQNLLVQNQALVGPAPARKIFLKISQQTLKQKPFEIQKLIEWIHLQGKEAYFYLGAPQYAVEHGEPILIWDSLLNYQKSNPSNFKFDGAYLDIRPYLLTDWKTNASAIMKRYQSLIKTLKIQRIFTNEKFPIVITIQPSWIFQNADTTDAYIYELMNYANAVAYDAGSFEFWEIELSLKKTLEYLTQIKAPLYFSINFKTIDDATTAAPQDYFNFQKQNLLQMYQTNSVFESLLIDEPFQKLHTAPKNQITQQFKAALKTHPIDGNFDDWEFKIENIVPLDSLVSSNAISVLHHNNNYVYIYFETASNIDSLSFWMSPNSLANTAFQKSLYRFQIRFEKQIGTTLRMLGRDALLSNIPGSVIYDRVAGKLRMVELAIPKSFFLATPDSRFPSEFLFGYRLNNASALPFKSNVVLE